MNNQAQNGIFGAIIIIASIFVAFILLMAFSEPLSLIFNQMEESGNQFSPSVGENMTRIKTMNNRIYTLIFGIIMVGGGIALFLGIAVKRRRQMPDEYERYGGDYE